MSDRTEYWLAYYERRKTDPAYIARRRQYAKKRYASLAPKREEGRHNRIERRLAKEVARLLDRANRDRVKLEKKAAREAERLAAEAAKDEAQARAERIVAAVRRGLSYAQVMREFHLASRGVVAGIIHRHG